MLATGAMALTGCNEDEAVAPIQIPQSDWKANTTIADFKALYWDDADNYNKEIGTTESGDHIILGGRVAANDISGNIYQNIILQDETAAVTIAVSMKDLNVKYKVGEEMFIDVTGLYAGKYSGLFEIGKDELYNNTTPQIGKMDEEVFLAHTQLNGLPDPSKVNVIEMTIDEINANKTDKEFLIKYQSQLIRINNVSFQGGGSTLWAERGTSHNTRYLFNSQSQSIAVDNSGMSDFNDQVLPAGHGDVIAILSYFRSSFQLLFRTNEDCIDFGGVSYAPESAPVSGDGTASSPWSVGAVQSGDASGSDQWVTGYIVGWIDGMSMSDGAKFEVPATSASNILLAPTPDTKYVGNCIPVQLTGDVRNALNLKDNPANLGKQVSIKGSLETYFAAKGLKSPSLYAWGDKGDDSGTPVVPDPVPGTGDGSSAKPFDVAQMLGGATGTGVWMTGYIVGCVNDKSIATDAAFAAPFTNQANILIAASATETDYTKCVAVQLPAGDVRSALNLVDNVSNLGKQVTLKGNCEKYFGVAGLKSVSAYNWGSTGTGDTPATTVTFKKVSTITSGKEYLIVASGKMALLNTANYGYLQVPDNTVSGDQITADAANAFKFTSTTGGYTITMSDGRQLYQTGAFNSFNFSASPTEGNVWTVEAQSDGTFKITNNSVSKFIQFDSQYGSYGSYSDARGVLPNLYERVN